MTNVKAFLRLAKPLFGLTKDSKFSWTPIFQGTFVTPKKCLVASLILTRLDFSQPFILDINWSIKRVGATLLQQIERHE